MILSRQEVFDLTGYQRPSFQINWLKRNHVRFKVAADGYPRILRKDLENQQDKEPQKPNLEAVRRLS